jgi:Uncharacterised nucleotidyltransferase
VASRRMTTGPNLVKALAWGIGGPPIAEAQFGAEEFLEAARHHRIAGRIIERSVAQPQAWLSGELLVSLAEEQDRQVQVLEQRMATIGELAAAYGPAHEPIVVVKGISSYVLTGSHRAWARESTDVDILAGNPEAAMAQLVRLGYRFDQGVAPHELARLERDGAYIEVQAYVPVYSAPDGMDHGSPWRRDDSADIHSVIRRDVRISDLLIDSTPFHVHGGEVHIPSAEMAALIICAHLYRNQLSLPGPSRLATVRLCELAELIDLQRMPTFCQDRFEALIDRFNANRALSYTNDLIDALLSPQEEEAQGARGMELSRSLWWDNGQHGFVCKTSPAESLSDLIVRSSSLDQLLETLGTNEIRATASLESSKYASFDQEGAQVLALVGAYSVQAEVLEIELSACWDWEIGLRFDVTIFPELSDPFDREGFLWNFGSAIFECEFGPPGSVEAVTMDRLHDPGPDLATVRASATCGGRSRHFLIPWAVLGAQNQPPESVALVLGVRRRRRLIALPHSATIVPMRISPVSERMR